MKTSLATLLLGAFLCVSSPALAEDVELGPDAFDLNKATAEQLMEIPDANITPEMANEIVQMAKTEPFELPEDFLKVPGLDNHTLQAINPIEHGGTLWYDPDAELTLAPSKC